MCPWRSVAIFYVFLTTALLEGREIHPQENVNDNHVSNLKRNNYFIGLITHDSAMTLNALLLSVDCTQLILTLIAY